MKFLTRLFERRAVGPSEPVLDLRGAVTTASSVTITPEVAIQVPAVFACVQVLSQDVGRTPIKFRQKVGRDKYEDAVNHDLWEVLGTLPNPEMTAYHFKAAMQWNLLQFGRAYAEIVRVDGRVQALWPLDPRHMFVDRTEQRVKRWTYSHARGQTQWLFDPNRPPIFELTHETPLVRCRDLVGTARALEVYTAKFFAHGGRPTGVLQSAGQISQATADRLRTFWSTTFEKPENSHKVAILDNGLEFKPIASANDEAQLTELTLAVNTAIAGVFRVPTFKIGDLTKATYSNMEAGELAYVTSTLDPYFQAWEEAIRRDLLTSRQYPQFVATFDRSALIRSDVQAQHQALATGIQAGFYSQNDARRALGLNPIADGDNYRINSALVPVASVGSEPSAA
jgi:HK97 family phage portal protein